MRWLNEALALGVTRRGGWSIADGARYLVKVEPRFALWIEQSGYASHWTEERNEHHFASLAKTLTYQQVSVAAGASIFNKFLCALGIPSADELIPELVRDAVFSTAIIEGKEKQTINGVACGLSAAKAKYIQSLARHFLDPASLGGPTRLENLSDDVLVQKLLAVDGVGQWSAHMFMLFKLQRPNVMALGDLGVRRGIAKMFGISDNVWRKMKEAEFLELVGKWAPYSSLACSLMWKADQVNLLVAGPSQIETTGAKNENKNTGDVVGEEGGEMDRAGSRKATKRKSDVVTLGDVNAEKAKERRKSSRKA